MLGNNKSPPKITKYMGRIFGLLTILIGNINVIVKNAKSEYILISEIVWQVRIPFANNNNNHNHTLQQQKPSKLQIKTQQKQQQQQQQQLQRQHQSKQ